MRQLFTKRSINPIVELPLTHIAFIYTAFIQSAGKNQFFYAIGEAWFI